MKDKTIMNFKLYAEISEKNCSKFGLKKLKHDQKDKLFEKLSLLLYGILKFIK